MIDDNFGALCSICRRRDYIPYACKKCGLKFCDEHYWSKERHACLEHEGEKREVRVNTRVHLCSQCKCKIYTVNHFYCPHCQQLLCLKHRHPETHTCTLNNESSCALI